MTPDVLHLAAVREVKTITVDDLRGQLTCTVETAGLALGIGRGAAYAAAARGELPTLRLGRRLLVPVPALLQLVGATPEHHGRDGPQPV